jgi:hypothetical protein
MHPSGHSLGQPVTKRAVLGPGQPHGTRTTSWNSQLGMGQRSGGQSAGIVVLVTVGHGVVLGGSCVMPVVTTGGLLDGRDGGLGNSGPRPRDVEMGHGWSWIRIDTPQPLLGHF